MVVGVLLAVSLIVLGLGTGLLQRRTLRRMHEERFMPGSDLVYFRGQVRRRLALAVILMLIGCMIGYAFLSGMEERADKFGDKQKDAQANAEVKQPDDAEKSEPDPEERRFAKFWGGYWIVIVGLVGLVVCVAILDFWATRVYWMARYREMRAEHEAKLQRDLAVYRQQKLNDRMKGPRKDESDGPGDEDDAG